MESTAQVSVANPSRKVCVCGSETKTEYFSVTARDIGMVNLTASVSEHSIMQHHSAVYFALLQKV